MPDHWKTVRELRERASHARQASVALAAEATEYEAAADALAAKIATNDQYAPIHYGNCTECGRSIFYGLDYDPAHRCEITGNPCEA